MTNREFFEVMTFLAIGSIVINVLIGLHRWPRLGISQRYLVLLVSIAVIAELGAFILRGYGEPTYVIFHIYAVLEYVLLSGIFMNAFGQSKLSVTLRWSILFVIVFAMLNALLWQPLSSPNTNVVIVSGLILISISTLFLFRILNRMAYRHIERSAMFWISISVLIYFASTVLMFAFLTELVPWDMKVTGSVLILNAVFNVIHYICFTIALWMKPE